MASRAHWLDRRAQHPDLRIQAGFLCARYGQIRSNRAYFTAAIRRAASAKSSPFLSPLTVRLMRNQPSPFAP